MFIIFVGCEYSGTSTISKSLKPELKKILGSEFDIHDHWKLPNIECYPQYSKQYVLNKTDKSHISQFTPKLKEMLQRQSLVYHLPEPKVSIDKIYVGYHFDDTVYAQSIPQDMLILLQLVYSFRFTIVNWWQIQIPM